MKKILALAIVILNILLLSNCENNISILDEVRNSVIGPIGEFQLRQDTLEVLDGSTITFDNTPINITRNITFTIRNTGIGNLELIGEDEVLISTTGTFSTTMPDSVISSGSSVDFTITFDPSDIITYSSQVVIETGLEEFPSFTFYIEGAGTEVDNTPPSGVIGIESGATHINSLIVDLSMAADDGTGSGVTQMKISNDGSFAGDWMPYSSIFSNWPMTPGSDGVRIVYTKFRDAAGNESSGVSDTITYDSDSPWGTATSPVDLETNVARDSNIFIQFDESMDPGSINTSTFKLYRGTTQQNGIIAYIDPSYRFDPASYLLSGTTYTVVVNTGVKDLAGNSLPSNYSWTFTTLQDDPYEGSWNNNYWEDYYNLWTTNEFSNDGVQDDYGSLDSPAYNGDGRLWDEDWYRVHVSSNDTWPHITASYKAGSTGANLSMQIMDENEVIIASDSNTDYADIWWEPNLSSPGEYYYIRIYSSSAYTGRTYSLVWEDCDDCGI